MLRVHLYADVRWAQSGCWPATTDRPSGVRRLRDTVVVSSTKGGFAISSEIHPWGAAPFHFPTDPDWPQAAKALWLSAVEAHGGWDRWNTLDHLRIRPIQFTGMLPLMKGYPHTFQLSGRVDLYLRHQLGIFHDFPTTGQRGIFHRGSVGMVDADDPDPLPKVRPHGASFAGFSKLRRWSPLDALHFFGRVSWHFNSLPYSLGLGRFIALHTRMDGGRRLRGIEVEFPEDIPTLGPRQTVYFGEDHRIARHDYLADVVGPWAKTCHYWQDMVCVEGFWTPRRRHVRLRAGDSPTPVVALELQFADLEVHGVSLRER